MKLRKSEILRCCYLDAGTTTHNPALALDYYLKALQIQQNVLPHNHRSIGITYRSIGLVYENLEKYQEALEYFQKAFIVYKAQNRIFNELQNVDNDIKRIQQAILNPKSQPKSHFRVRRFFNNVPTDTKPIPSKPPTETSQADFPDTLKQTSNRRIILLGRCNTVKSSVRDALVSPENPSMRNSQNPESAIRENEDICRVRFRDFYGRMLVVVDTPSFVIPTDDPNSIICQEIKRSLELIQPGPHAFVLILEFNSDSSYSEEDDKKFIELILNTFGPKVFEYMVILFTNLEQLQKHGIEIDRYLKNCQSSSLKELMKKCQGRYIPINNQAPVNAKDASFAALLLTIDRMLTDNGGIEYYSSTI